MKERFFIMIAVAILSYNGVTGQSHNRLVERSIELPGEIKLSYVEQGARNGIPVILLHGFPDSWHSYENVLPYLPASLRVYALSQRGHGNSSRPATGYRPEDFAADVAFFMLKLKIPEAIIVGHSMGGTIAQCFAIRYPEMTKGLVLIGSFVSLSKREDVMEYAKTVVATLNDPIDSKVPYEFQQSTLAKPISPSFFDTLMSESMKVPAKVWREVFAGLVKTDYTEALKTIGKSTMLIWGDKDEMALREDQNILMAAIPVCRLNVYEGTGHSVHWEEPVRFADDLISFIRMVID